jgi:chromosomal replication initiator protein
VTIESIQKLVADSYGVKVSHLRSKNNAKLVALPRHVAMYLSKELTGSSLPEIGRRFGGKHHSTVLHAVRKIARMRDEDSDFDKRIQGLIELLQ